MLAAAMIGLAVSQGFASEATMAPSLESNARAALSVAEQAVAEASRKKALWIPAQDSLHRARAALARGEFEEAIRQAEAAQQFAELGIRQLDYPPYRPFQ